jgi:PKD repeat protein
MTPLVASDADGEPLTYTVLTPPANGILAGDGASRTYTPAHDFNGNDSFTFRANDGFMNSRTATVRITVAPVNDAPVVELAPAGPVDEAAAPVTLTTQASDVDGDKVALSWATDVGTLVPAGATATFAADDGPATANVTVAGDDGHGGIAAATGAIDVRNVTPTPQVGAVPAALWGLPVGFTATASDASLADTAAGLAASWDFGDGSPAASGLAVSHVYSDAGTYTATLTVTDKDGGSGAATAAVTVDYTTTIAGDVTGQLRVAAGQSVRLAPGAALQGPLTVEPGGTLDVAGAAVVGPLRARGAAWLRLCGATIAGPLEAAAGTGPVLIGDATAACAPNTFGGPVALTGNLAGVSVVGATIVGPLRVTGNAGGTIVNGNTIHGPLVVTGNAEPVTHSPNTVDGRATLQ